jgi:hypothetical protein
MAVSSVLVYLLVWHSEEIDVGCQYDTTIVHCIDQGCFTITSQMGPRRKCYASSKGV